MKNKIKYLISSILLIFIFFSSISFTNASRWKLDKLLNIKFWVEQIEYKLLELPNRTFTNTKIQVKYNKIKKINRILTQKFYEEYEKWNIDYYTTKWIIKNHKYFIHNINILFTYFESKIKYPKNKSLNNSIINTYSQIRINYNRISFLYNRSQK